MKNKPPPLNRDYNRDPNIKALKRRGFVNHGSTLPEIRRLSAVLVTWRTYLEVHGWLYVG